MKFPLLIALVCLCFAGTSAAQNRVELYADQGQTQCAITEATSPPVVQVYAFLTGSVNATGVRFKAPKPDCWVGATWVGDTITTPGYLTIGTSQIDWSIAFGACLAPPIYLGAINFTVSGQALPCCEVEVLPALQYVFTDCEFTEIDLADAKTIVVNPNPSCQCQQLVLGTEESTWGRVKSLYR